MDWLMLLFGALGGICGYIAGRLGVWLAKRRKIRSAFLEALIQVLPLMILIATILIISKLG